MKLRVDNENDAVYFKLDESNILESEEIQPGIILDYNSNNQVIGIEILNIKNRVSLEQLKSLQFVTV